MMSEMEISNLKQKFQTDPLWYQDERVLEFLALFKREYLTRTEKAFKFQFIKLLKNTNFYISETGYNWDQWRLPIEYCVIHHTSSTPTISLSELNVLGLRLYINQFLTDDDVKNQPLYSGHYWFGKPHIKKNMTFVSYHYLIRPTGKIIQIVDPDAYLWHAGNFDINRKSIGIAIAGKLENYEPSDAVIKSIQKIITTHHIKKENIFGHMEVRDKKILGETDCPGNLFLTNWKNKVLAGV